MKKRATKEVAALKKKLDKVKKDAKKETVAFKKKFAAATKKLQRKTPKKRTAKKKK